MMLFGEGEVTIDAKNRFSLPVVFKKHFTENEKMMLARGIDENLVLYPMATWNRLIEKILKMDEFDDNVRKFRTLILAGATEIQLDNTGRILIPPTLKEAGKISKDIMLAGDIDKIFIWDPATYKERNQKTTSKEFSDAAKAASATIK